MSARFHLSRLAALILAALLAARGVGADTDSVVKLTKFNFDDNVRSGAWFVKFYAPWCTHCQRLAPVWADLADQAVAGEWQVKIAEVDCTVSNEVCDKVKVKAFPTLILINDGVLQGKYSGAPDAKSLQEWLNSQQVTGGQRIVDDQESTSATAKVSVTVDKSAVASAVLSNLVSRFPTKNRILNIYIYGGVLLTTVVTALLLIFRSIEGEEEHEKAS